MPQTVDTPFFQHAANYSGRAVRAMPPILPAERVARAIVRLAEHPRREGFVGLAARLLWLQYVLAPRLTERMLGAQAERFQLSTDETAPQTQGSLYHPMMEGVGISGGWMTTSGAREATASKRRPLTAGLVPLLPLLSLGLLVWSMIRGRGPARGSARA